MKAKDNGFKLAEEFFTAVQKKKRSNCSFFFSVLCSSLLFLLFVVIFVSCFIFLILCSSMFECGILRPPNPHNPIVVPLFNLCNPSPLLSTPISTYCLLIQLPTIAQLICSSTSLSNLYTDIFMFAAVGLSSPRQSLM